MSKYNEESVIARYVEAGWGDLIMATCEVPQAPLGRFGFGDRTTTFYKSMSQLIEKTCQSQEIIPRRVLEIGSASGRLLRELATSLPDLDKLIGCEPAEELARLSVEILTGSLGDGVLSIPWGPPLSTVKLEVTEAFRSRAALPPLQRSRVEVVVYPVESFPAETEPFDVVLCLNVIDRHPSPAALVRLACDLIKPGVCCSSPAPSIGMRG